MNLKFYKDTNRIGGGITEITSHGSRIILDFGSDLPNGDSATPEPIPQIDGVTYGKPDCDGIFITHYHGDHNGLLQYVLPEIPVFMGEGAKAVSAVLCKRIHKEFLPRIEGIEGVTAPKKINIGNAFRVMPIRVDHSAFDAYMYVIELLQENKKILFTGDYRSHGFIGKALLPTARKYIGKVDCIITEGTMLSRKEKNIETENELERRAEKIMKNEEALFVLCSSTNIDRIAALYNAAMKTGRVFVVDEYQRDVLQAVDQNCNDTPFYQCRNLFVYSDKHLRSDKVAKYFNDKGFCMLVRSNGDKFVKRMQPYRKGGLLLYSMWNGYKDSSENVKEFLRTWGAGRIENFHTSGHASAETIKKLCNICSDENTVILPMHTEAAERFKDIGLNGKIFYPRQDTCYDWQNINEESKM